MAGNTPAGPKAGPSNYKLAVKAVVLQSGAEPPTSATSTTRSAVRLGEGAVKVKRWNDPVDPGDGHRVLNTTYWPGGIRKSAATWDRWCKELTPSQILYADRYRNAEKKITWPEFSKRFLDEMDTPDARAAIDELAKAHRQGQVITLLCNCKDEKECHCVLAKQCIEKWEQWFEVPEEIAYPDRLGILPATRGSYILEFHLDERIVVTPKTLGSVALGPGRFRYYGSAFGSGGLRSRITHHLRRDKKPWWHADRITVRQTPTRVMVTDYLTECGLCQRDLDSGKWVVAAVGFGTAGDLRHCESHLLVEVESSDSRNEKVEHHRGDCRRQATTLRSRRK